MSVSRRFFLYGAGTLVTSSFAARAAAYAERTGEPLLITPDSIKGELHFYEDGLLSLGPWLSEPDRRAPTWREYLGDAQASGKRLDNEAWQDVWDITSGPTARAYHLLNGLGLGPDQRPSSRRGWLEGLEFVEGSHPGDSSHFVIAEDPVVLSLLQGRLIELGSGLRLVEGQ